jgi:hypothetical protein
MDGWLDFSLQQELFLSFKQLNKNNKKNNFTPFNVVCRIYFSAQGFLYLMRNSTK